MKIRPLTLEAPAFHWGDPYIISYQLDRWVANRRDNESLFAADTLAELETQIEADYKKNPVRACQK
jgi:hypothetical protein